MLDYKTAQIVDFCGDIPDSFLEKILSETDIAWDIETSGLDWKIEEIGTCQLYIPKSEIIVIVQVKERPENLCKLLADSNIRKIFHHAMFDLRFMKYKWEVSAKNVVCTKIAAKLLRLDGSNNGLKSILLEFLNIDINKEEQIQQSNWLKKRLSQKQIKYAINDVAYLPELYNVLFRELRRATLSNLALRCYRHLPTQAELEIRGYNDIYKY